MHIEIQSLPSTSISSLKFPARTQVLSLRLRMHILLHEDPARTLLHPHVFLHSGYTLLGMTALADYLIAQRAGARHLPARVTHVTYLWAEQ